MAFGQSHIRIAPSSSKLTHWKTAGWNLKNLRSG